MGLKVHYFTLDRKDIEIRCTLDSNAIKIERPPDVFDSICVPQD